MTLYCVDTSAWHHAADSAVALHWRTALESDSVGICDHVRLEILYSVRSASDYDALNQELDALRPIPCTMEAFGKAVETQQRLAHVGGLHHRSVKIADLVIAAAADLAGATVWHYDADYERIAAVTGQPHEWIAPRGSL